MGGGQTSRENNCVGIYIQEYRADLFQSELHIFSLSLSRYLLTQPLGPKHGRARAQNAFAYVSPVLFLWRKAAVASSFTKSFQKKAERRVASGVKSEWARRVMEQVAWRGFQRAVRRESTAPWARSRNSYCSSRDPISAPPYMTSTPPLPHHRRQMLQIWQKRHKYERDVVKYSPKTYP